MTILIKILKTQNFYDIFLKSTLGICAILIFTLPNARKRPILRTISFCALLLRKNYNGARKLIGLS